MAEEIIGIIGGTGLGDELGQYLTNTKSHDIKTPFGKPSAPVIVGTAGNRQIAFLSRHGTGHKLAPSEVPFAANIFALKELGARTVIASGAVGSLQDNLCPGDLVIVDQFIDKTFKRQNTFFTGYAAVHCEMAQPICRRLAKKLFQTAKDSDITTHPEGTYVCMEGPQFSTRAESLMHKSWGADLIGMTAMPEAKLAREAQMCYVLIALVSDYDCWRPHDTQIDKQTLLKEIIANLKTATNNCLKLIKNVLAGDGQLTWQNCHCRNSLDLAVWTDPKQVKPDDKDKLKVLFQ